MLHLAQLYIQELAASAAFVSVFSVFVLVLGWLVARPVTASILCKIRLWASQGRYRRYPLVRQGLKRWVWFLWALRLTLFIGFARFALGLLQSHQSIQQFGTWLYGHASLIAVSLPAQIVYQLALIFLLVKVTLKLAVFNRALHKKLVRYWLQQFQTKGIKIQQAELLSGKQIHTLGLRGLWYLQWLLDLVLGLMALTALFSIWPQTRTIVYKLLEKILSSIQSAWNGVVSYFPDLLNLVLIVLATFLLLRLIRTVFVAIQQHKIVLPNFPADWAIPTYQVIRFVILALMLVIAFPYLPGSSSPAFQGVSVFIGVLLSLGSTSFISNIVAGVVLTYTNAFKLGDRVQIADSEGDIIGKTLLVTKIRTVKNVDISIPNGMVLNAHIKNFSSQNTERPLVLSVTLTLGYDLDWRHVHQTLIESAQRTAHVLGQPEPFVLQKGLDDFYVRYELNAYTDQPHLMARTYSDLYQNLQDHCAEKGIEILSPHYRMVRTESKPD